ncbi:Uncharacterized conserved protein YbbC, DUF1343 family [Catalinimonas alkaloidigena]|uniref:Uncharacterized conserved protein YbbC, DUF1343 family n=1 Tax=Catalinimonas alkaloidigena TaxID=1075417 RepID=A0A1G8XXH6_9BACT|nr:DUF1343 domain-containing protein [Catalinimonas alkaloidigena]SDJ95167.1 Uncharacterized conserved protein YbbC, DUF1343 family [Catalinimonas alkaloidigena]
MRIASAPWWLFALCLYLSVGCTSASRPAVTDADSAAVPRVDTVRPLQVGAAQFEVYLPQLKGRAVGIVANHTSLVEGAHLVDLLREKDVNLKRIFTPEHGFRGNVGDGEHIDSGIDPTTGLPIASLYGANRKPKPEWLQDLDVVLFDLQDVGTRFYTYISTMHYMMAECARQGKLFIVLDRPNPNGEFVDGPIREEKLKGFVAMHPIPILHGLTVGELAQMINGEGWLGEGLECPLQVIPVANYTHQTPYEPPVKPSPNLPNYHAIRLYPSLCLFEGTVVSIGRGTPFPFQVAGAPDPAYGAFTFTPVPMPESSPHPPQEGKKCYGVDYREVNITGLSLEPLLSFYRNSPDKATFFNKNNYINTLSGTPTFQEQVKAGKTEAEIRASWEPALSQYKAMRKNYLLYAE